VNVWNSGPGDATGSSTRQLQRRAWHPSMALDSSEIDSSYKREAPASGSEI